MLTHFHNGGILGDIESLWERVFLCIFLDLLIYSFMLSNYIRIYDSKEFLLNFKNYIA